MKESSEKKYKNNPDKRNLYCDYHTGTFSGTECKFFEIGLGRTASRSVFQAVSKLGVRAMHGYGGCKMCHDDLEFKFSLGRCDCDVFNAYEYSGQIAYLFWRELMNNRPDAKFILTLRPFEQWMDSLCVRLGKAYPRHRFLIGFRTFWEGCFDAKGNVIRSKIECKCHKYVQDVIKAFSNSNRLLILDVFSEKPSDLWSKLGEFVGKDVTGCLQEEFPHKKAPINCFNSLKNYIQFLTEVGKR